MRAFYYNKAGTLCETSNHGASVRDTYLVMRKTPPADDCQVAADLLESLGYSVFAGHLRNESWAHWYPQEALKALREKGFTEIADFMTPETATETLYAHTVQAFMGRYRVYLPQGQSMSDDIIREVEARIMGEPFLAADYRKIEQRALANISTSFIPPKGKR